MQTFLQWVFKEDLTTDPQRNITHTGKFFDKFSTDVSRGTFGRSAEPFRPVLANKGFEHVEDEMGRHLGHFDDHIAKSIPTFREVAVRKAHAIVATFKGQRASMLDIGGDEGSLPKTVTALSRGMITSRVLDPNRAMHDFFNSKSRVPGSTYDNRAFIAGWVEDDGTEVPGVHAGNHDQRYDIVHEAMTFQFINRDRARHIGEAKRLMTPGGLLIAQEKFVMPEGDWHRNERLKDLEHKQRYYSGEDLAAKQKVVGVTFGGEPKRPDAAPKVNMVDNMVTVPEFEQILTSHFREVVQFWDAGNFKGYVASDDAARLGRFVAAMGNLNTKFSTVRTPRRVTGGGNA